MRDVQFLKLSDIDGNDLVLNASEIESIRSVGAGYHHGAQATIVMKSKITHSVRQSVDEIKKALWI